MVTPYAQKQYHENKGNGLRGKEWDQRCWADNGDQIVQSAADFVGGKAEWSVIASVREHLSRTIRIISIR